MEYVNQKCDQHVHTTFSHDGKSTIEEYCKYALKNGISCITFTDHMDYDWPSIGIDSVYNPLLEFDELTKIKNLYPQLNLQLGIELGWTITSHEKCLKMLKKCEYGVVNLSMHIANNIDFYFKDVALKYGIDNFLNLYYDSTLEMVRSFQDFDVLSHIDYGFKTAFLFDKSLKVSKYENTLTKIMEYLIEKDKCLEINTKVQNSIDHPDHLVYLLRLYKKLGGKHLTLSSDAHTCDRLCDNFEKYIKIIKQEGFNHLCFFRNRERLELSI